MTAITNDYSSKRSFLFLQGPHGSFFRQLAHVLQKSGYQAYNVVFNGGDMVLNSRFKHSYYFQGSIASWPQYYVKLLTKNNITDIVLYGDKRAYHTTAIHIAKTKNINIWVFEEGYIRPGYVTLEPNGVNSKSLIPELYLNAYNEYIATKAIPKEYNRPEQSILPPAPILPNPMLKRINLAISYYIGIWFLMPFYPFYTWHRSQGFTSEILGWMLRSYHNLNYRRTNERILANIDQHTGGYYLLPLQLASDAQIKCCSTFRDIADVIETVAYSFTKYAPKNSLLVIKVHPLDNTFFNYKKFIDNLNIALNLTNRIKFIISCDNKKLLTKCKGVVVVNSTMGISAISEGKPTIALGDAIYTGPGLAQCALVNGHYVEELLHQFWCNLIAPTPQLVNLFLTVLKKNSLVPGNFYTRLGRRQAIDYSLVKLKVKKPHGIQACHIFSSGIRKIKHLETFLADIDTECVIGWGYRPTTAKARKYAQNHEIPFYALEDGFIKTAGYDIAHANIYSLILDKGGIYYDANSDSDLKNCLINSSWFTEELKSRAQRLREYIVKYKISKYNITNTKAQFDKAMDLEADDAELNTTNYDELFENISLTPNSSNTLQNLQPAKDSVLLIDQTFGDCSISCGLASEQSFCDMLETALLSHKPSNIYVKVHPNVYAGNKKGYFKISDLKKLGVNIIDWQINTIELAQLFKDVYTVTSGFGFEALLCGANVTVFGCPFYAGWGLTNDKLPGTSLERAQRCMKKVDIDLLTAAVFFKYSIFVDPKTGKRSTPEAAIASIVALRNKG